jgi:hypothetical protein
MFLYLYDLKMLPMILLGMLTGTVFLTWLYNSTRESVLTITLWHGLYDAVTASEAGEGMIAAVVTGLVMVWAVVVVVWFKPANLSIPQGEARRRGDIAHHAKIESDESNSDALSKERVLESRASSLLARDVSIYLEESHHLSCYWRTE